MGAAMMMAAAGARGSSGGALLTDLVAHWDLTEAGTGTRLDAHTGGFDLTDSNNNVNAATGPDGVTLSADFGTSGARQLIVGHDIAFNPEDEWFLLNCWVYSQGGFANNAGVICKGNAGLSGGEWSLRNGNTAADPETIGLRARNAANSGIANSVTGAVLAKATWAMITCVHDPDGNQVRTYVNGVLEGVAALSGGVYSGSNGLSFGALNTSFNTRFYGRIQAASIWKGPGAEAALAEIAWLYNGGLGARFYADLVSH